MSVEETVTSRLGSKADQAAHVSGQPQRTNAAPMMWPGVPAVYSWLHASASVKAALTLLQPLRHPGDTSDRLRGTSAISPSHHQPLFFIFPLLLVVLALSVDALRHQPLPICPTLLPKHCK